MATTPCTGGAITYDGDYVVHTFTESGDFVTPKPILATLLLVAAGGGTYAGNGSTISPGGGGAGGMLEQTDRAIVPGTYPVVIGAGVSNDNGGNSTFDGLTAIGGGKAVNGTGANGGSGGGGVAAGGTKQQGNDDGATGYGNNGASGLSDSGWYYGGAGGGAGGVPTNGANKAGGIGRSNSITGEAVTYAKGGDGSAYTSSDGAANTGNGANGSYFNQGVKPARAGGSGIFVIRYLLASVLGGGLFTFHG